LFPTSKSFELFRTDRTKIILFIFRARCKSSAEVCIIMLNFFFWGEMLCSLVEIYARGLSYCLVLECSNLYSHHHNNLRSYLMMLIYLCFLPSLMYSKVFCFFRLVTYLYFMFLYVFFLYLFGIFQLCD
jgi:hypothetical protein